MDEVLRLCVSDVNRSMHTSLVDVEAVKGAILGR